VTTGNASTAFSSLKDFQVDTVEYVLRRLYDDRTPVDRFLVADEVGMGKTLVARGVIAGAIERLQFDPSVDRIDIVYICSNADIARQNISKLNVRGDGGTPLSTRITLLATQLRDLNRKMADGTKTVNLVAFTPGTSFERGHRGGRVSERALLWWLVNDLFQDSLRQRNSLARVLRMGVQDRTWENELYWYKSEQIVPDEVIVRQFRRALRPSKVLAELRQIVEEMEGISQFKGERWQRRAEIVSALRGLLAKVSVKCLEPDLVILDEFQRFKHLLEQPEEGEEEEISQLANDLFNAADAKVLLLSATPYKMLTLPEESASTGDDHYSDFVSTVHFLYGEGGDASLVALKEALVALRTRAIAGDDIAMSKAAIEDLLRQVMCRTERPLEGVADMLTTKLAQPGSPTSDDLLGFVAMKGIADAVGGQLSVEYWKSAPYFLNFMDGYQLSQRFRDFEFAWGERPKLLRHAQLISRSDLKSDVEIEPGNARLRQLMAETLDKGLWRLLWLPPSMPYHQPAGAYAEIDPLTTTKSLIFSSWAAAPSAIASILSLTASQRMRSRRRDGGPKRPRLVYRNVKGAPGGMTSLALFVPTPGLAGVTDPLGVAKATPWRTPTIEEMVVRAESDVAPLVGKSRKASSSLSPDSWYWASPFAIDATARFEGLSAIISDDETDKEDKGLHGHLVNADKAATAGIALGSQPADLHHWVTLVGLAGPGNVAWRALRRVTEGVPGLTEQGVFEAAAIIGAGFRTLFNRLEVMALLDQKGSRRPYWRRVLEYCLAGNLQAVMDEYLHHLVGNRDPENDEDLLNLARSVRAALALRTSPVHGFDPYTPDEPMNFPLRFALRYGTAKGKAKSDDKSVSRMSDVQGAFNSPFWPMVLASTSVGQEGIDFHWWCHSLVHWNLPANPVDFEQREGRVLRFKGHAIRKNVGSINREAALASGKQDPWVAAFDAAVEGRPSGMNDLWPWWAYEGEVKVERWVPNFPMSIDKIREERLKHQLALYRLAFGQPRQEDLIGILETRVAEGDLIEDLRIDLRPPTLKDGTLAVQ